MSTWIQTLPTDLQEQINSLITSNPSSYTILENLYKYLTDEGSFNKKRKIESTIIKQEATPAFSSALKAEEIIFELPSVSFQSPLRKKLNLTFHLTEQNGQPTPVLSIVNPTNYVPELSITNLKDSIRLCIVIPILGNSTNPQKKSIVSLCFWIRDEFASDPAKNDPIICQINLDLIKKHMIKSGKLPSNVEDQLSQATETSNLYLNAVQERIVDYFQRQFKLCGIDLKIYLPLNNIFNCKMNLNTDNGIALSSNASSNNDFIIIDAHKGSKEGALVLLTTKSGESFIIYGFKKPILLFEVTLIKNISYSNITRNTFNLLISTANDKNEDKPIEFGMIDQQYFQVLDDFVKSQRINDDSFNEHLREKTGEQPQEQPDTDKSQVAADDDDEDGEDGDYQGAVEEGSEVDEEYDSNAGENSADEDGNEEEEEDDGVFNQNKEEED